MAGLAAFTRRYFQGLYRQFGNSFAFVFDSYYEVAVQSPLHEVMSIALSEVPPGGSVILISRSNPPAPMARLRANRALEVIGWRDLKLTEEEPSAIAAQRGHALDSSRLHEPYGCRHLHIFQQRNVPGAYRQLRKRLRSQGL